MPYPQIYGLWAPVEELVQVPTGQHKLLFQEVMPYHSIGKGIDTTVHAEA